MEGEREACVGSDKYRSFLRDEINGTTEWRHGGPPIFDSVNLLFEQGRTKVWGEGSLEETVQNAIKTWEMELSHKTRLQDFRSLNPQKFKLIVNGMHLLNTYCQQTKLLAQDSCMRGKVGLSGEETLKIGSYNALLKNSLPEEFKYYKADEETFESSHDAFRSAFPRGFAWEVISVHSGPPVISYKFRHWGYFEGPYKGHAPTGEMIQLYGMGILKVDESLRAEDVEVYYDPAELFGGLLKGPSHSVVQIDATDSSAKPTASRCPFH